MTNNYFGVHVGGSLERVPGKYKKLRKYKEIIPALEELKVIQRTSLLIKI